jgi:acetyltransferase-like isoleucine patch superfamily enzyme
MNRLVRKLMTSIYRRLAVTGNVRVGARLHVGPGSRLWAPSALVVEDDVYIGKWCTIEVDGRIGSGTLIANNVGIVGRRDHDIQQLGVPMSRARWVGDPENSDLRTCVDIGRNVWLGFGSIVVAPVTIGDEAVIAAGTVVTNDVGPGQIVGGNPQRLIRRRRPVVDSSGSSQ